MSSGHYTTHTKELTDWVIIHFISFQIEYSPKCPFHFFLIDRPYSLSAALVLMLHAIVFAEKPSNMIDRVHAFVARCYTFLWSYNYG